MLGSPGLKAPGLCLAQPQTDHGGSERGGKVLQECEETAGQWHSSVTGAVDKLFVGSS